MTRCTIETSSGGINTRLIAIVEKSERRNVNNSWLRFSDEERDLPRGRRRREGQHHRDEGHPRRDGLGGRRLRLGARPSRPRPPLRHRQLQAPPRAGLDAPAHRLRRGPGRHHRLVPRQRGLVAPRQGGHRGQVRQAGAVGSSS